MALEQQILAALRDASPTPTSAGSRVFAMQLPQNVSQPSIRYQRIANTPVDDYDGHANLDEVRMQIDSFATTYAGAKQLADEVRAAMVGAVFDALLITDRDDYEPETKLYRVSADYQCWAR